MSVTVTEQIIMVAVIAGAALAVMADCILLMLHLWFYEQVQAGERRPLFAEKWSLTHPWWGGQLAAGLLVAAAIVLSGVFSVHRTPGQPAQAPPAFIISVMIVQNALLVAVAGFYVLRRYGQRLEDIGLRWPPTMREVKIGVVAGLAMLGAGVAAEFSTGVLARAVLPPDVLRVLKGLTGVTDPGRFVSQVAHSPGLVLSLLVAFAIVAPIGEEVFFRAFLHGCARRRLGSRWGTVVSSGAFALVHGGPLAIPAIFCLGLLLAIAYDKTGSLWVSIIMHGVNNALLVSAVALASGSGR